MSKPIVQFTLSALVCLVPILSVYFWGWGVYQILFLFWLESAVLISIALLKYLLSGIYHWRNLLFTLVSLPTLTVTFIAFFSGYFLFLCSNYDEQYVNKFSVWSIPEFVLEIIHDNNLAPFAIGIVFYAFFQWLQVFKREFILDRRLIFPVGMLFRLMGFHCLVFVIAISESVLAWSAASVWIVCLSRLWLEWKQFKKISRTSSCLVKPQIQS